MIQIYPTQVGFKLVADEFCVAITVQEARKKLRESIRNGDNQVRLNLLRRGIDVFNKYVAGL